MTVITDDLPARLLHEEHEGWHAICEGRGGDYYSRVMTSDAVMIVPGAVIERTSIRASFDSTPPWEEYEIHEPRVIRLGSTGGILVYRAIARRGESTQSIQMSTTYVMTDGQWRIAAHQQTQAEAQ